LGVGIHGSRISAIGSRTREVVVKRLAISALAVLALGLGFHLGPGLGKAQGEDVVGGYFTIMFAGARLCVTDGGGVYFSDGGNWVYAGHHAPPGIVDIHLFEFWEGPYVVTYALALTATGEIWRRDDLGTPGPWSYTTTLGDGQSFVSIEPQYMGPFEPPFPIAMTACGDLYRSYKGYTWNYLGNVFVEGPRAAERETWGEMKGGFGENVVGGYFTVGNNSLCVTDGGGVYFSPGGIDNWSYSGHHAPPGIVDVEMIEFYWYAIEPRGFALALTASGEVWQRDDPLTPGPWSYVITLGDGQSFISIESLYVGPWEPAHPRVMATCGDLYFWEHQPVPWSYEGNVFGNGPSAVELETWGEMKSRFRE
jgi:hypothetical protein